MTDSKTDAEWQAICDSYAEENQRLSDQLAVVRRYDAEIATGIEANALLGDESGPVLGLWKQAQSLSDRQKWYLAETIANEIGHSLTPDEDAAPARCDAEIGEHLHQIKAFASSINERNFFDIALHIERQVEAALSLPAAEGKTP